MRSNDPPHTQPEWQPPSKEPPPPSQARLTVTGKPRLEGRRLTHHPLDDEPMLRYVKNSGTLSSLSTRALTHKYKSQETKTSAMAPPTCNEIKCAAFILHMGIRLGEKQSCKT